MSSCLGIRYLDENESLLYKQSVDKGHNLNNEAIKSQIVQNPNKRFLLLPISPEIYVYQIGLKSFDTAKVERKKKKIQDKYTRKIQKAEKEKKIGRLQNKQVNKIEKINRKLSEGNLFMRWGEPPTVFDSTAVSTSTTNIERYLFSKGYFNAEVTPEITHRNKKLTKVSYEIEQNEVYVVDSIFYSIEDDEINKIVTENEAENLILNRKYNQELISDERDRIYELLTDKGYYDFKRQYIHFAVDSTNLDNNRLIIKESIITPPDEGHHKKFKLDSVIFKTGNQVNLTKDYRNITYNFSNDKYNVKILDWRLFLYPDSLYSRSLTLQTQKQLSYLDMFKFVNINYDTTGGEFIANIFTSPLDKYQTSTEVGLSVTDQAQVPGPFFSFNLKNRNLFKGMEILEFTGNISIQGLSGVSNQETRYSRFQYGGEFSLTFPQFLFPLGKYYKAKIGKYNPKTKLTLGVNFEDRKDEYERLTFNTGLSYIWQVKDNSQFTLKPFDISYIDSNPTQAFTETLQSFEDRGNISYVRAFSPAFVSSSSFNMDLNINNYGLDYRDASFMRILIETGGNLQKMFEKILPEDSLEYYKFVKSNIDFRQTFRLNRLTSIAYRINVGAAFVYGENNSLPYEKYYFAGGSNSIRAWQPRRVGPGAFGEISPTTSEHQEVSIDYNREQPGDIIIESSVEYRRKLLKFLDGALFIDAGNVWLWNSETVNPADDPEGDDGVFRFNSFLSELAVGTGLGFRIDFSFLILRLDGAWKLFNPAYPKGDRFVGDEITIKNLFNLKDDIFTINIGIGYPF